MTVTYYTGDEIIADVLMDLPEAYEVFGSYGLGCAGCPISPMESIKQGAAAHGMDTKICDQLIEDLNEIMAEQDIDF